MDGQYYHIMGEMLRNPDGSLSAAAQRVIAAAKLYGRPNWVHQTNKYGDNWTSPIINAFHAAKVNCAVTIKLGFTSSTSVGRPLADIKADIDHQMSIGPEIDLIYFDEAPAGVNLTNVPSALTTVDSAVAYARSKGKQVATNPGTMNVNAIMAGYSDLVGVEWFWEQFAAAHPNLITLYPEKWMGQSPFGGTVSLTNVFVPYQAGTDNTAMAIADCKKAWSTGIKYYSLRNVMPEIALGQGIGGGSEPLWPDFEKFLAALAVVIPPPATIYYNVDIWAIKGGTTDKTGTLTYTAGSTVSITATAAAGYSFGGWLVNNVQHPATENPLVIVVNAGVTVIPIFTETPTPPASTQTGRTPAPIIIILGLLAGAAVAAGAA